jgi:hypothetical protein
VNIFLRIYSKARTREKERREKEREREGESEKEWERCQRDARETMPENNN